MLSQLANIPVTTTTKFCPKVLRYKWEAYCNTNGRRTAMQMGVLTVFPFPQSVGAPKVLQYKLEAYCNTNWRWCIAILFSEVVVVGLSDILLNNVSQTFKRIRCFLRREGQWDWNILDISTWVTLMLALNGPGFVCRCLPRFQAARLEDLYTALWGPKWLHK